MRDAFEMAKLNGDLWRLYALRREVLGWLGAWVGRAPGRVGIAAVPASRRRLLARGYDLPTILARWAASWPGARRASRALVRRGESPRQGSLTRQDRLANVTDCFQAGRRVPPRVILIDDVITTGATVAACADALAAAGAEWIGVLSLARTARRSAPVPSAPRTRSRRRVG